MDIYIIGLLLAMAGLFMVRLCFDGSAVQAEKKEGRVKGSLLVGNKRPSCGTFFT